LTALIHRVLLAVSCCL